MKKYLYILLLTYEQLFIYRDERKVCFEICKASFYDRVETRHRLVGFGCDFTKLK